ncbi:hypothetical protein [Nocardia vermiculata]|uniref:Phospholipase A2 n=1 Tax=Nocardia vermiculata TaxID=257274 RepID=A0A846XSN9_9NOCA|nr:hypothetical protein [Nocardia vermiculata]NKY49627.1 hypothetical protein [Nocardia vermiculata]
MTDASPGPAGHRARPHVPTVPPPRAPRRRGLQRIRQVVGSVALAVMTAMVPLAFVPAMPAAASAPQPGIENAAARAAVVALVGEHPDRVTLPADFGAEAGYRPQVENGLMVDPGGSCSSPVELPAEFTEACKAHDLGYDLLRYAEQQRQPLHSWARQAIDATLQRRMHAACDQRADTAARAGCDVVATVATTGVDLNSLRQSYATPNAEYLFGSQLSGEDLQHQLLRYAGPAALGVAVAAFAGTVLWRRMRVNRAAAAVEAGVTR